VRINAMQCCPWEGQQDTIGDLVSALMNHGALLRYQTAPADNF
jgi:hypothetical protein